MKITQGVFLRYSRVRVLIDPYRHKQAFRGCQYQNKLITSLRGLKINLKHIGETIMPKGMGTYGSTKGRPPKKKKKGKKKK